MADCNPDALQEEIKAQRIEVLRCTQLKQKGDPPYPYRIYLITVKHSVDLKDLRKIKYIYYLKIRWERYRNTRRVTQCHRCQMFGHGTNHCHNKPRCVKCRENHLTINCDKKKEEKPQCINCMGSHPANYSGYPKYQEHLSKVTGKTRSRLNSNRLERAVQHTS